MCKEILEKLFGTKEKERLDLIMYDLRTITAQSMFLSRQINRPPYVTPKYAVTGTIIDNLEKASDIITPDAYTPPEGMIYQKQSDVPRAIFDKYGLKKSWLTLDLLYKFPEWKYMQLLYLWDWTDKKKYIAEFGDCDKFARIFQTHMIEFAMINGIGLVIDYSGGHSYNMLFDIQLKENGIDVDIVKSKLIVLEPQSDEWEEVPIVTANAYVPSFPRWRAIKKEISGLDPKMYPLKDCYIIM